ncbi:hypothetical protein THAOC_28750, partial [Thalassiosira oceanica]
MPESETADNSALEYIPPLTPWCTSGQYWPSSDGPVYRASSRWVYCFTAFVTRGRPKLCCCGDGDGDGTGKRESIGWAGRATDQRESDACSGPSECRHGRPRSVGDATRPLTHRDGACPPHRRQARQGRRRMISGFIGTDVEATYKDRGTRLMRNRSPTSREEEAAIDGAPSAKERPDDFCAAEAT